MRLRAAPHRQELRGQAGSVLTEQMSSRGKMLAIIELPRFCVHMYGRLYGQAMRRRRERVRDDVAVQKRCHLHEHQRLLLLPVRERLRGP